MTETDFANRLSSFMSVYLPHDRNVSKHTLASYKVAFIDFIIFMEKQKSVSVNRIMLKHVNRENKGTRAFNKTIKAYLEERAENDALFAVKFANPSKSVEDCVTYYE